MSVALLEEQVRLDTSGCEQPLFTPYVSFRFMFFTRFHSDSRLQLLAMPQSIK